MKLELQNGDRITIPEGCKAQINGNEVVIEKEGKSKEFNRGDILASLYNEIILVDDYDFVEGYLYSFVHVDGSGVLSKEPYFQWNECYDWRPATEEEKQLLFDKMKEQGLRWNDEKKCVEKLRWRAKEGEEYYYVNSNMEVSSICRPKDGEYKCDYEGNSYLIGNYFRTYEQAKEAARRMNEDLLKYHEEIRE